MRVPQTAPADVQQAFRDVWDAMDGVLGAKNLDLHGRRIINAGDAIDGSDYVTKRTVTSVVQTELAATPKDSGAVAVTPGIIYVGTHAERVAHTASPSGALWYETDRTLFYLAFGSVWNYASGTMKSAPGDVAVFPPGINPGTPASPSPADLATGVSVTPTLTWTVTPAATNYDVYFGNANPPPLVSAAQVGLSYVAGTLAAGTNYYWFIVAHAPSGATVGPTWSFTTTAGSGTPPAIPTGTGSIYRSGYSLRRTSDNSHYFALGVTAFTLLKDWLDGGAGAVDPFLDWMVANNLEIARALGMYSGGVGFFDPQAYGAAYFTGIGTLVDHMATKTRRLKLSLFADHQVAPLSTIVQATHFNAVAAVMAGKGYAWLDGGNEYGKNGWNPAALTWPANLMCGRGSNLGDQTPPFDPFWEFEFHSLRSDAWPRSTKSIRDIQTGNTNEGLAVATAGGIDEPIGIAEADEPGRSSANADDWFDFVANPFGSYIVLHTRSSITSLGLPGPVAQACVNAAVYAASLIPAAFRDGAAGYTASHIAGFPLDPGPLNGAGDPAWWLRAYGRIIGNEAWVTIIRPNYGAGLVVSGANGWSVIAQYGARQNVVYLTR